MTVTAFAEDQDKNLVFDYEVRCRCKDCGREFREFFPKITMTIKEALGDNPVPFCNQCSEKRNRLKEQRERKQYLASVFEKANIPFCYLQNYNSERGNMGLLNFVLDNCGKNIYISGDRGIGKTWAVCESAKRLILANVGKTFLFLNWEETVKDYLAASSESENAGNRFRRSLLAADVIILDDFGKGSFCQRSVDLFYYLTNKIYESINKKLWITANFSADYYVDNLYGEKFKVDLDAAFSRLARMENFISWKQ